MKKAVLLLFLIAPLAQAEPEPSNRLEILYCNGGYETCVNGQTRAAWVKARARVLLGCITGYESNCNAVVGTIYTIWVYENGTTSAHNCTNDHYIYEIGTISITDPFSGAQGKSFIVSQAAPEHCSASSCNPGCGTGGNCTGLQ